MATDAVDIRLAHFAYGRHLGRGAESLDGTLETGLSFFYHHVGGSGADEDFPKTIFNRVSLDRILSAIPLAHPRRDFMVEELPRRFTEGSCNCWGVPAGASDLGNETDPLAASASRVY